MKLLNKKGMILFLVLAVSPFSVWGAISVTLPTGEGPIHVDDHKRDWRDEYRHRHGEGRRVCK